MLRRRDGNDVEPGKDIAHASSSRAAGSQCPVSQVQVQVDTNMMDRMAELERALIIAKEDQDALREELDKAKEHRRVEKATIEDLRTQLANTNSHTRSPPARSSVESRRSSEKRRSGDHLNEDIIRQNYDLRYRVAQLQEQLSQDTPSHDDSDYNALKLRLHATEKESQERLQQLLSLKSSISTFTRVDSQVTDVELRESFSQLANRIREWVVSNYRRSKLSFDQVLPDDREELSSIWSNYQNVLPTDRFAFYQAVVSSELMKVFDEPLMPGLPHDSALKVFKEAAKLLDGDSTEEHEWRSLTVRAFEQSGFGEELRSSYQSSLRAHAYNIERRLFALTNITPTPGADTALHGIVSTAADLQRTLILHKARYQVYFLYNKDSDTQEFDSSTMEPINDVESALDGDGDTATEQTFLFCVFPCLEKSGDEWGKHLQTSNIISRARVCCGVG